MVIISSEHSTLLHHSTLLVSIHYILSPKHVSSYHLLLFCSHTFDEGHDNLYSWVLPQGCSVSTTRTDPCFTSVILQFSCKHTECSCSGLCLHSSEDSKFSNEALLKSELSLCADFCSREQ